MTDSPNPATGSPQEPAEGHPTQRLNPQPTQDLSNGETVAPQAGRGGWTRQPLLVGAGIAVLLSGLVGVAVGFSMASDPVPASSTVQQQDAGQPGAGTGENGPMQQDGGRHGAGGERGGHRGYEGGQRGY